MGFEVLLLFAGLVVGYWYPRPMAFLVPPLAAAIYYVGLRSSWWDAGNEVGWGSATVWMAIFVLVAVIIGIVLAALIRNPRAEP